MITLIILVALVAIGWVVSVKSYDYEVIGTIVAVLSGIYLLVHLACIGLSSYDYEMFVVKRNAFSETLKSARENGNEYETAAIVKEVANFNTELASTKYNNKTIFLDQYIDDRFDSLTPIK